MTNKKIIIGGTFEFLHNGHKALLKKAFELGEVYIGLVSDEMAQKSRQREVEKFESRKKELEDFINKEIKGIADIFEINDKFGPTLSEDFDCIVVSPETHEGALVINEEREKLGKKLIEIIKVDYILAQDGQPISSTRIAAGEIDKEGRLLKGS